MIKLSDILKKMHPSISFEVYNEVEIETLALLNSSIDQIYCSFVENLTFLQEIEENVKMLIASTELKEAISELGIGVIICDNPRILYFEIHNYLAKNKYYIRSNNKNCISEKAKISEMSFISSNNVIIEDDVIIEPFVTVYENVTIKKNSIIRSGARLGSEGYEYKNNNDKIMSVKHLGGVIIEENVEIQVNTCIDKAVYPWDNTVIGNYTKIDNLVHIAHGCKIGANVMVVANSGIGGRTIIEDNCWIGFGSTIRNGIVINENARVNMGAVVTKSVDKNVAVTGNFAIEHSKFIEKLKLK